MPKESFVTRCSLLFPERAGARLLIQGIRPPEHGGFAGAGQGAAPSRRAGASSHRDSRRLVSSVAARHNGRGWRFACPVFANGNGIPMTIIRTLLFALVALVAVPALGLAQPFSQYEKASFDKLVKSGKPVVVHVHADW
jgi:hypothetical protein